MYISAQHESNYALGRSKDSFCPSPAITLKIRAGIEFLVWHNLNCIFVTHNRLELDCKMFLSVDYVAYIYSVVSSLVSLFVNSDAMILKFE